ncbi:uncharacterized protein LOC120353050 [Nilaparvata lugens]|uniref:uncharacterized protein LOC120353050 n=1 Tax=Nilaparvata lugens TaxID=108931 RepID=UPI00193D1D27|nr:uncharacterized protein LOC120353050 [Nilaparvata lugens]
MLADYERIVGKLGRNQEHIYDTVAPDNLANILIPENNMAGNDKRPFAKPESYGGTKSEDFNEWLKTFNRAAKINKWDEDDKILYLPLYLKKTALAIFDIFSDKNENATFLDAVGHLKSKLVDPVHEETTRQKLENRNKLPTETYTEYTADIIKLCHILEPQMSEKRIVGYVLRGLDVGALQHVAFMDNASVEDLEKNLAKYERSRFLLDKKLGMHNASILSDDEEDDCQFKEKGLCLIPRKKMSNSATQATCLHLLTSEADVSELREVCKFDCKATDNQTLITRLREDTFLFHNTGKKTTIRCKNSTTEVPSNSPGTLSLHIPCNCELQDDNGDVLISTLYPCDSRSHPSPAINNLIPHMWTNLSKLSIPIFKHETLPQYLNLSEILNENWHLNFSKFEEHNSFSEDIFHHVEMPNNFDLLGVNNKLIIYIIIVWQTLITVIFLYLCLQNYIKKKANQLRVPKRTPIVDYPQEL